MNREGVGLNGFEFKTAATSVMPPAQNAVYRHTCCGVTFFSDQTYATCLICLDLSYSFQHAGVEEIHALRSGATTVPGGSS